MKWERTPDPNVIQSGPYFILRCAGPTGTRYLLGRGSQAAECLGGFDTSDEAKKAAERHEAHREQ